MLLSVKILYYLLLGVQIQEAAGHVVAGSHSALLVYNKRR